MAGPKARADALLSEAYLKYQLDITKYCTVRLRENKSAVEDCVQETFLVYYNRLLKDEEFKNVRAFLYRTADNICKGADTKFIREAKKNADIESFEEVEAAPVDFRAADIDYDELRELLIAELSDDEQRLYRLKYEQKKSLREIGEILDIPPNAVANRTSRLRTKVKNLIAPIIEKHTKGGVML
ncbi:MAG: sigma-70 family RNA polymerase sigma factor [Eubacterium sp.]|nr:sigma-70 family RNA polymerase sigma factor [Eubacterium sp.]